MIGAAVQATFCRTHPQQKQQAISPPDRREVGHRPADWGVIPFPTLQQA
jgi:hypothetical protein